MARPIYVRFDVPADLATKSLEALELVDYWSVTTIVEDGHQYWRTYYAFEGNHHVVPLFTPIYQDAVLAGSFKDTVKEQYLQKKRWSWGVSDIPYVMEHTIGNKKIPWVDRWANALILWEAHLSWSTASIVLATASWLPLIMNIGFRSSVLAYNFPIVYKVLNCYDYPASGSYWCFCCSGDNGTYSRGYWPPGYSHAGWYCSQ